MIGAMTIADGWKNCGVMIVYLIYSDVIILYPHMKKNFYTTHSENETRSFLRESIIDSDNEYDNATVTDIIVEDCNIPVSSLSIREAAMEKIKNMSDEELKLRILL